MDLTVATARPDAGTAVLTVAGEIDLSTAPRLREALLEIFSTGGARHLVVDLADVTFMDSTGLGVLVGAHRRIAAADAKMTVVAQNHVRRIMEVTGLHGLWRTVGNIAEAL